MKPSGTFKTPNWPERDYPAGVSCSWHIVAPKNQVKHLQYSKVKSGNNRMKLKRDVNTISGFNLDLD